ncbi:hypothetical protein AAG570_004158 [Ranatra chinensis]|uniref:Malonyl-CoA decarboxylase n=1 Tax=Ranatra chinensis TaxID=642074 RepID=A0ABD0YFI4_9HEMI
MLRRQSTLEDEQRTIGLLMDILEYQDIKVCSWIIENKVKILCFSYKGLLKPHRDGFLKVLATNYSVDHETLHSYMNKFKDNQPGSTNLLKAEEQLQSVLTPQYSWLFKYIGRLENGVKFLVDMRTDVLELLQHTDSSDSCYIPLQHLNTTLKEYLSLWFTVGFLHLERITWKSPCEMMQKISEYEAVHPVRSWTDLKRRVGAYRRCFVYTHSSMPSEPLVVLHTALSTEIASSMKGIVAAAQRMSVDGSVMGGILGQDTETEDPSCVKAAIFYSITSTQKGLQGIELGNYLIKRVVNELQYEFPLMSQFSTLSPIPRFRLWLMDRITEMEKGCGRLPQDLWEPLLKKASGSWKEIKRIINTNMWYTELNMGNIMMNPLMAACAEYLYKEKVNGVAVNSVANFHLRNGAVMWRLNWLADTSPHGLSNSCGMMVNYRYFLEDTETNSRNYLENKEINASEQIKKLVGEFIPSKM